MRSQSIRLLVAALWIFGGAACVVAQDKTGGTAPTTQSSKGLDGSTLEFLDQWIETSRTRWAVPGLAVAVVQDGKVVLCKGYGVRKNGTEEAADGDTLFAIASNSKAFTSAALAVLVDEGKLRWDDRVGKYLPWLRLSDPLASEDLRIRDLLCHRSGLGTFSGDLLWWGTPYQPREILERAVHLEPENPFRGGFGYSNLMFLAAGEVIASVSGQSWQQFVEDRFLTPLHMERTRVSVRQLEGMANVASPHKTLPGESVPIDWMPWDAMAAAGGIISSADDMSHWLCLQLNDGKLPDGQSLISSNNLFEMWQPQTIIPISRGRSMRTPSTHFKAYGLGWSLSDYQGVKLVGHSGGYDGMYSEVLMVPEKKLGIVVLTNSMTSIGSAITYKIVDSALGVPDRDWSEENLQQFQRSREAFYQRIQKATTPVVENTQPSHALDSYTGAFECPLYGNASVEFVEGKLQLRLLPYPELVADLEHLHYDTFVVKWKRSFAWFNEGTALFVPDASGTFQRIELNVPNDDLWFHELKLRRVAK